MWQRSTLALVALTALTLAAPARQDSKPEDVKADPTADAVRQIAMAAELAEMGRATKTPDMLVTAARILRRIRTAPGTGKTTVEGTEEKGEPVSLTAQSDALLKEARTMAPDDAALGDLIARAAKDAPPAADKTGPQGRGSLIGPRTYFHRPGAGTVVTLATTFQGGMPASVAVTGNGRNSLTLTVTGPGGHYYTWTGLNPSVTWVPNATKTFTISIKNNGPGAAAYTLYHN